MAQVLGFILVFLCYLGGIDPSGWRISSLTFLMLCGCLDLRLISKKGVMGLSFFFVFTGNLIAVLPIGVFLGFFNRRAMAFWAFGIDFPNIKGWFEVSVCLSISDFLYHFVPHI